MLDQNNTTAFAGGLAESVSSNGYKSDVRSNAVQRGVPLSESDFLKFAGSFVAPEIIRQAKLFRVDSAEGAELMARTPNANKDYAGVVFPYFLSEVSYPREYRLRRVISAATIGLFRTFGAKRIAKL